jgi:hypothetical protein
MRKEFGEGSLYEWIVMGSAVTCPYRKYWSASVTLAGMDINGTGDTIQKAYKNLQDQIESSKTYFTAFANLKKT